MKKAIAYSILSFGRAVALAVLPVGPATNAVPTVLSWDAQPGVSNVDWRVYSTTNIMTPTNQWPLLSVGTNAVVIGSRVYLTNALLPGTYFFTVTGSNFWSGESFFSVAAASGPSPGVFPNPVQNLVLKLP